MDGDNMARIIIDVRTALEFRLGHSNKAKNLPLPQLEKKIEKFASRDDEVWLCCASGARSAQAAGKLKALGYRKIKDIGPWTNL